MDRKTLLAVILSILALMIYQSMLPQRPIQRPDSEQTEMFQPVAAERYTAESTQKPSAPDALEMSTEKIAQIIKSQEVEIETTNIGAAIETVTINEYASTLSLTSIAALEETQHIVFKEVMYDPAAISYETLSENLHIKKSFSTTTGSHLINAKIAFTNNSESPQALAPGIIAFTIDHERTPDSDTNQRDRSLYEYSIAHGDTIVRKGNAFSFSQKNAEQRLVPVRWVGFRDKYFCAIVQPKFTATGYKIEPISDKKLSISFVSDRIVLEPNETIIYPMEIFVGPQDAALLTEYGRGFEDIVLYSNLLFGLVDTVARGAAKLMAFINSYVPNVGVSIIIVGLLMSCLTLPLTLKSMASMKKMQFVQPQLAKIRDQYKNNPQRLNQEMMALYKENKVNPFGGCLPIIFQMPIFIGFYQAIWRSILLKNASFLWIKDLSEPDRLFTFPFTIPFIGNEFNLLPIIYLLVMFVQQQITTRSMPATDPQQIAQQKMMSIFITVMIGVMFYKFSSGLTLFYLTFFLISVITQLKTSKIRLQAEHV